MKRRKFIQDCFGLMAGAAVGVPLADVLYSRRVPPDTAYGTSSMEILAGAQVDRSKALQQQLKWQSRMKMAELRRHTADTFYGMTS